MYSHFIDFNGQVILMCPVRSRPLILSPYNVPESSRLHSALLSTLPHTSILHTKYYINGLF